MNNADLMREQWNTLIEREDPVLGRYREVERLDSSGRSGHFSLMFRAFDTQSGEHVALKFFSPLAMQDHYRLACFTRECEILESFQGSDNIVQSVGGRQVLNVELVHQATGTPVAQPIPFVTMQLADSSVRQWLYEGEPDPITALEFFHEMCKAVQRVHSSGVCHRDIKPSNFLLFGSSDIRLTDFGTARRLGDRSSSLTERYDAPVGDLRYAAPELFLGLAPTDRTDLAGDMFALGAVLFELFTRVVLTSQVFDLGYRDAMQWVGVGFARLGQNERESLWREALSGIATAARLPSISDYDSIAPPSIHTQIDSVYQWLCSLDYQKRPETRDFSTIFRRVSICRVILANQAKYQWWLNEKRRRRARRAERRACADTREREELAGPASPG